MSDGLLSGLQLAFDARPFLVNPRGAVDAEIDEETLHYAVRDKAPKFEFAKRRDVLVSQLSRLPSNWLFPCHFPVNPAFEKPRFARFLGLRWQGYGAGNRCAAGTSSMFMRVF